MKTWFMAGALLVGTVAMAGATDEWKKTNPYNSKLAEPVTTLAISGMNVRLGMVLERITLLSGEGHRGKAVATGVLAAGVSLLGGSGDMASREPLNEHFFPDDAKKITDELAASIQQHLKVPGVTLVPAEQLAQVAALGAGKVSHELGEDSLKVKDGKFGPEYYYGYYMVPVQPYDFRARPKIGYTIGDGEVAPAVRAAVGAQAALNIDVFLVNNRKAFQVQELRVEVLTPQMIGRGRDTPTMVFELPEGSLAVPVSNDTHKDNYAAWQQMKPGFEAKLAELGSQIQAALEKGS